jgi:voltage-gated sodium channel
MEEDESEKSWGRRCILWVLSKLDMQQEPRLGIGFSIAAERSTLLENKRGEAALWRQKEDLNFHNRSPPVAFYLIVCNFAFTITQMGFFDNFIMACIFISAITTGIETYDDNIPQLIVLETTILWVFTIEVLLRLLSEGMSPIYYFIGRNYRWNLFDFVIVLCTTPLFSLGIGQNVSLLRIVRLLRLFKLVRKFPELQVILSGLVSGLKSIFYIFILMILTYFVYAVAGVLFFRANDPWHWRDLQTSMVTLFRISTLDAWGNIFYINYYGCAYYPGGFYTDDPSEVSDQIGGIMLCDEEAGGTPVFATFFFISFIILAAFCMLSLFVGAVGMGMNVAMVEMQETKARNRKERQINQLDAMIKTLKDPSKNDINTKLKLNLIRQAFSGRELDPHDFVADEDSNWMELMWLDESNIFVRFYKPLTEMSHRTCESPWFQNFITVTILLAGVVVGVQTTDHLQEALLIVDLIIQVIFTIEIILKFVLEGLHPWLFFHSRWNTFDLIIVIGSYISIEGGDFVVILRLLRLLRVVKLMRVLPQLQLIVTALVNGLASVGFIFLLIVIFTYLCAIVGILAFSANDPWHFGSLHMAMITLFQCSTLDDWNTIMYTNAYGCATFPLYADLNIESWCTDSQAQPFLAFLYFIFVVFGCALVLINLFIGVVALSMDEAQEEQELLKTVREKTEKIMKKRGVDRETVAMYSDVFDLIDFTDSHSISRNEMRFGLRLASMSLSDNEFELLYLKVDKDHSNQIDFSEFLTFILDLRYQMVAIEEVKKELALQESDLNESLTEGKQVQHDIVSRLQNLAHDRNETGEEKTVRTSKINDRVRRSFVKLAQKKIQDSINGAKGDEEHAAPRILKQDSVVGSLSRLTNLVRQSQKYHREEEEEEEGEGEVAKEERARKDDALEFDAVAQVWRRSVKPQNVATSGVKSPDSRSTSESRKKTRAKKLAVATLLGEQLRKSQSLVENIPDVSESSAPPGPTGAVPASLQAAVVAVSSKEPTLPRVSELSAEAADVSIVATPPQQQEEKLNATEDVVVPTIAPSHRNDQTPRHNTAISDVQRGLIPTRVLLDRDRRGLREEAAGTHDHCLHELSLLKAQYESELNEGTYSGSENMNSADTTQAAQAAQAFSEIASSLAARAARLVALPLSSYGRSHRQIVPVDDSFVGHEANQSVYEGDEGDSSGQSHGKDSQSTLSGPSRYLEDEKIEQKESPALELGVLDDKPDYWEKYLKATAHSRPQSRASSSSSASIALSRGERTLRDSRDLSFSPLGAMGPGIPQGFTNGVRSPGSYRRRDPLPSSPSGYQAPLTDPETEDS